MSIVRTRGNILAALGVVLMALAEGGCRPPPTVDAASEARSSQNAIHGFMAEVESAWQRRDFEAYLAHFAEDADLVNRVGRWFKGKAAIRQQLRWLDERGHPEMFVAQSKVEKVRFVAPGVVSLHQRRLDGSRLVSLATYLIARAPQGWRIQTLTIAPIEPPR
jgi:ketosteroid isomerase-like protein